MSRPFGRSISWMSGLLAHNRSITMWSFSLTLSMAPCCVTSWPASALAMAPFTFATALVTPLPMYALPAMRGWAPGREFD
jgi:hypothetical protein